MTKKQLEGTLSAVLKQAGVTAEEFLGAQGAFEQVPEGYVSITKWDWHCHVAESTGYKSGAKMKENI